MRKTLKWTILALTVVVAAGVATPVQAQDAGPEVVVPTPLPTDSRPVTGDFNGIGRDTIFWYSPGTVDRRWEGKTNKTFAEMEPAVAGGDYKPFTGDFNGDHRSDIFFFGPGAAGDVIWYGRADDAYDQVPAPTQAADDFDAVLPGDFNGDGRTDIVWYRPGHTVMWRSVTSPTNRFGGFNISPMSITNTYKPFVGDFNGDRRSDIFWYKAGSAADPIWYGQTNYSFTERRFAVDGHYKPLPGDYDGDGRTDVLWYKAGAGQDYTWYSQANNTFVSKKVTVNGTYKAFVGEFNGDHRSDIFWWGVGSDPDVTWFGQANRTFVAGPHVSA